MTSELNVVLAILEGRQGDARDMMRALPLSTVRGIPELQARIQASIDLQASHQVVDECRQVLAKALYFHPEDTAAEKFRDGFYEGLTKVEALVESMIRHHEHRIDEIGIMRLQRLEETDPS